VNFDRRQFLVLSAAALRVSAAPKPFEMSRVSFITDEASASPEDAIAFAHKYNLKWVELREVPGAKKAYTDLTDSELKAAARQLKEAGLRVAFFNSGGTKYALPGTELVRWSKMAPAEVEKQRASHAAQHAKRMEILQRSIAAAHAFDTKYIRVFSFGRVAEPEKLFPRVADELGGMGEIARKEGLLMLLENEPACNVGSCAEMAALIAKLPESTFGLNWDANNGQSMKEKPYPDGYSLLPKHRIKHVHMHGRTLLDPEKMLDWKTIFAALVKDGFRGAAGLETHYFDGTKIEKSHLCMQRLQEILSIRS